MNHTPNQQAQLVNIADALGQPAPSAATARQAARSGRWAEAWTFVQATIAVYDCLCGTLPLLSNVPCLACVAAYRRGELTEINPEQLRVAETTTLVLLSPQRAVGHGRQVGHFPHVPLYEEELFTESKASTIHSFSTAHGSTASHATPQAQPQEPRHVGQRRA